MSSHRHQHQIQLQTSQKTCHQLLKSLKVTDDHQIPQGDFNENQGFVGRDEDDSSSNIQGQDENELF